MIHRYESDKRYLPDLSEPNATKLQPVDQKILVK